jgi:hypothetical protein
MSESPQTTARTHVERQAIDRLDDAGSDPELDAVELVSELDFGHWQGDDGYPDWHEKEPMEPMIRALFLRELEGLTPQEHADRMEASDAADRFGFDLDDGEGPCRTTYSRAWNERFSDDLRQYIEHVATRIREYAHEIGNPLGLDAFDSEGEADNSDLSRRTKNRLIGETAREVLKHTSKLVFPAFGITRDGASPYDDEVYLGAECLMGLNNAAAEAGMETYGDNVADAAKALSGDEGDSGDNLDDAPSASDEDMHSLLEALTDTDVDTLVEEVEEQPDTPTGEAHLDAIQTFSRADTLEATHEAITRVMNAARLHREFDRQVDVAIDMTYVGYWADRDEVAMAMGAPPSEDFVSCFKFATLCVVGDNMKFALALRPVRKGDTMGEVVRDLLARATQHVQVDTVYADAEFAAADVITAMEQRRLNYLIRKPKRDRVKRFIDRMNEDVAVKHDHTIYGPVSGGPSNTPASTTLVAVPSDNDEENTVAFITNIDVDDETPVERRWTQGVINRYRRRWGIENSYKTIKDFLASTTSKDYSVRLFHFAFAVLLYDVWLLTDLLVKKMLEEVFEYRNKPRLKADRFLNILDNFLIPVG